MQKRNPCNALPKKKGFLSFFSCVNLTNFALFVFYGGGGGGEEKFTKFLYVTKLKKERKKKEKSLIG
jgi:hypothetical protein